MSDFPTLRALVVEDEVVIRQSMVRALGEWHFQCDEAANGEEAAAHLQRQSYDVVITDLRMPKRHGHSLATQLLEHPDRPLVIVVTGVLEPRLATDLLARGVDDIVFKPVNFQLLGAKVRGLCDRRQKTACQPPPLSGEQQAAAAAFSAERLTAQVVERRLNELAGSFPMSSAALQVLELIERGAPSPGEVAAAIACDPMLTMEVLRLANSSLYSAGGKRVDELKQAVTRVGDRPIVEVILASAAAAPLKSAPELAAEFQAAWRRSQATSLLLRKLYPLAELGADEEGLFLSALLLPVSRLLMKFAFPDYYRQLLEHCQKLGCSLVQVERWALPMSPCRAMAGFLARWNVSPRLYKPLQHAGQPYGELRTLSEPLRSKVERLRVADLLGWLAVGVFSPWDEVEFPLPETMARMRVADLVDLWQEVRSELACSKERPPLIGATAIEQRRTEATPAQLIYFKLGLEPHDFLLMTLDALAIDVTKVSRDVACQLGPTVVNCLDASPERISWFLNDAIPHSGRSLVLSSDLPPHSETSGPAITLPCSFALLDSTLAAAMV